VTKSHFCADYKSVKVRRFIYLRNYYSPILLKTAAAAAAAARFYHRLPNVMEGLKLYIIF
jgi:hypothetical protein